MRTRLILLAVPLLLLASSAVVESGESEPVGDVTLLNEEERTVKRYSWQGIPVIDDELGATIRVPRPRLLRLHELDAPTVLYERGWDMTGRIGPSNLLNPDSLEKSIEELVDVAWARDDAAGLTVRGTSAQHEQVAWLIEQLRAYYAQRINFTVHELDEPTESGAIPAERARALRTGAKLIASRKVRPGELTLVSNVRTFAYTGDYDLRVATSASVSAPNMMKMNTGRELALSGFATGDGGLLVRGIHGNSRLIRMREFGGPGDAGVIEQPDFEYELQEGAVKLRDGQAWVFGDQFLVHAEIAEPFVQAASPDGELKLRLFAPGPYSTRWASTLHAVPGNEHSLLHFNSYPPYWEGVMQELETFDHKPGWTECIHSEVVAAIRAANPNRVQSVGPLICATWWEGIVPESAPQIDEPGAVSLHVRRYLVESNADLPEGLLQGAPDESELQTLGEPGFSRLYSQLEDGLIEDASLRLSNYLASFDANSATGVAVFDPVVHTMVAGSRLRIALDRDGPDGVTFDALFATAPPGKIEPSAAPANKHGRIQTASIESTAVRLAGTLKVGESVSTITPSPTYEEQLIVLVITRVEP